MMLRRVLWCRQKAVKDVGRAWLSSGRGGDDKKEGYSPIPERLQRYSRNRGNPESLLKQGQGKNDETSWITPEVMNDFESEVLTGDMKMIHPDYEHDPEGADEWAQERWAYLLRRRQPGIGINPEEYDYTNHWKDREKPSDLLLNLERAQGKYNTHLPKCQPKYKRHIVPQHLINFANLPILREFVTEVGAIKRRNHSRLCGKCQRRLAKNIKLGRQLGLLPWTVGWKEYNLIGFPDEDHKSRISKTI